MQIKNRPQLNEEFMISRINKLAGHSFEFRIEFVSAYTIRPANVQI